MLKKIGCRALAALLALCLLVGCGSSGMKDGVYTGTGAGHGGELRVSLTVAGGTIAALEISEHNEDDAYAADALAALPAEIVASQSLGVDAVSGATITSRAVFAAAADAVKQAGGDPTAMGFVPQEEIADADTITIKGLPGGDVMLTGEQLKSDFEAVEVDAVSISSSGEEKQTHAVGVKLETILQGLGVSQRDYAAIVTTASDGYAIEIPDGILQTRDILIAYEINGEAQSPRTVIPDERAMYWSKFLAVIELVGAEDLAVEPVTKILFLESVADDLADAVEDYKHYDALNKALPVSAIWERYFANTEPPKYVTFMSLDGLTKKEKFDNFTAEYIMLTGEETHVPLFTGPQLPEGMRVKQLLFAQIGDTVILSFATAARLNESEQIALTKVLSFCGLDAPLGVSFLPQDGGEPLAISADRIPRAYLEPGRAGVPVLMAGDDRWAYVLGLEAAQ